MSDPKQIEIKYKSLDGTEHSAFIWPLVRIEGVKVIHKVMSVLGGLTLGGNITAALQALDFDTFLSIAKPLLRNATIDLVECKDIETFDGFNQRYLDLYILVFEALKVNYPDFFSVIGRIGDFARYIEAKKSTK
jgi:hypothetical protein